jgi:hypothetical protein
MERNQDREGCLRFSCGAFAISLPWCRKWPVLLALDATGDRASPQPGVSARTALGA